MTAAGPSSGEVVSSGPVRVLVVEDDEPTRTRLVTTLRQEPRFDVYEAGTLAEARGLAESHSPAVLLVDLRLPDGDGTELIRELRAGARRIEILVITVLCDERKVVDAVEAGATGYLLKDALPEDINQAVWQLLDGGSPVSSGVARHILRRLAIQQRPGPEAPALTQRELDILWAVAKGLMNHEIAESLGLSRHTVPGYIKNIYRKLEAGNRGEAVYQAVRHRLIRL